VKSYAYGFPRIGANREYKQAIEGYWQGNVSAKEMKDKLDELQQGMLLTYEKYVDFFPVGEMTLYDHVFDTACMVGLYKAENVDRYYDYCRGKNTLKMTKWFNTNYHYLVPNFSGRQYADLQLQWNKAREYKEKFGKGLPYLLGPFTFLKLSEGFGRKNWEEFLMSLGEVYKKALESLGEVHIDEPAFVTDVTGEEVAAAKKVYHLLASSGCQINLFTYYDGVDFLKELYDFPVKAIGLDFVHGNENLTFIEKHGFPEEKILIAGVVDGRNVWRTDIRKTVGMLQELLKKAKRIAASNAGPLYHLPLTVKGENLPQGLLDQLAFAEERLYELQLIAKFNGGKEIPEWRVASKFGTDEAVRARVSQLNESDFKKAVPYHERIERQKELLKLPAFPATTIGSFPQTAELRKKRADFRAGRISEDDYKKFIKQNISDLVKLQEELGLDVLVHGEFERTDMVEFFAEKMDGIATTKNGWIISYGTRGYRPPVIYGDVSRPEPMTLEEITFAQSLTNKPVKGMLTGCITIIAWSFVREDVPESEVAYQIGSCLRDEVKDYEIAGIKIVQVDEPAIREKAPIKKRNWDKYFDWAIKSFNLTTNTSPQTQIHTHMCYSDFSEIINQIVQMDFDVISIEAARSKGEIIESFAQVDFARQMGIGVWDVHSPVVPSTNDMAEIVQRVLRVMPGKNVWINPDCGLKTRQWEETLLALKNLSNLSRHLRLKVE